MNNLEPLEIHIFLANGQSRVLFQPDPALALRICDDLEGHTFTRDALIVESAAGVTSFPSRMIVGISLLVDPLPASFTERENLAQSVTTQIGLETFELELRHAAQPVEGHRSLSFADLEFSDGRHIYLQENSVADTQIDERIEMRNLYKYPAVYCRRLGGGLSFWNTSQLVSWSHYPKIHSPVGSWRAEATSGVALGELGGRTPMPQLL